MQLSTRTSSSDSNAEEPPKKLHNHAPPSLSQLPDEITLSCLARVPRCYYPSASLVSTTLRRLIASPQIYAERSLLRRTEHVLYVALRPYCTQTLRWYTLNLIEPNFGQEESGSVVKHRLVPAPSFPSVPYWGISTVAVGSEIYFLGGCVDGSFVSTAFVVDCPSYTCRSLPSMKQERGCAAAGIVDGKLYVMGGCDPLSSNWVEAFDLKTQTWETVTWGLYNNVEEVYEKTIRSFAMDDKICIMDRNSSFVYDPKEGSLESDLLLNTRWRVGSCVIDDKMYSFDLENKLWEFDPVSRVWSQVKGLEDFSVERCDVSKMASYGGKIAILCNLDRRSTEIWYTEIGLERREGGEVWGTILCSSLVLASDGFSTIVRSLSVSF
ncbi:F-box/kelch-repeat protein [Raphanus sativus]|uniref:F-box/kelch-repeat protein At4g39240 n=1 Tax=Raphanus sativus TaxID=3726 RepID=A0A6J0NJD2_RAPSA|nr:F-box/kelch-repeat protein At4g39240 [Raphanus sativus]XP_018484229.1 F-box/kelch-repeat protein At4g39240 [Raphanus sativus]KAJ4898717.1 F-box/kelch-repeat protein [Raphanus sativus]